MDADQETLDYVGICRLQAAYADAVTRRAWSDLEALFLPDAPVTVDTVTSDPFEFVGAAGIGGFIAGAVERFEFFELVILNVHVLGGDDADAARSRSFTCELRQERANGHWTNAFGVYHDDAPARRRAVALRAPAVPVDRAHRPRRGVSRSRSRPASA